MAASSGLTDRARRLRAAFRAAFRTVEAGATPRHERRLGRRLARDGMALLRAAEAVWPALGREVEGGV